MIKFYFKQAWQMMRQNKLFSAIYIGGTAIAIATTTVFAVIYYVKLAPMYPEYNRANTGYFETISYSKKNVNFHQSSVGYEFLRDHLYGLKNAECVSGIVDTSWNNDYVLASNGVSTIKINSMPTDPNFFKIYRYDFIEGAPFNQSELESGIHKAVITDALADKLFGSAKGAVGKTVTFNYKDYTVAGVVRAGSTINTSSYGEIFIPYTTYPGYDSSLHHFLGDFNAVIIADDMDAVRAEIAEIERKHNTSQDESEINLFNQPMSHVKKAFGFWPGQDFSLSEVLRKHLITLLVLLLVPALNLSGMISGRMEVRSSELGLRKSFGATRGVLLTQVMWENLLLTLFGGIIGLMISMTVIYASSGKILMLLNEYGAIFSDETTVIPEMMFSPWVFLIALTLCLILNLMAALVPAWMSLRRPIVQSLKDK